METIGRDLAEMQRVPLAPRHVAALRAVGAEMRYAAGATVVRAGDPVESIVYVEDGEIEVVDPLTDERRVPSTVGQGQFLGEIALLYGGNASMQMRAARDTRALVVPRPELLRLMSEIPEMSDIKTTTVTVALRADGLCALNLAAVPQTVDASEPISPAP